MASCHALEYAAQGSHAGIRTAVMIAFIKMQQLVFLCFKTKFCSLAEVNNMWTDTLQESYFSIKCENKVSE